jgi:hypothetical protein
LLRDFEVTIVAKKVGNSQRGRQPEEEERPSWSDRLIDLAFEPKGGI